jgi:hypothetical protein
MNPQENLWQKYVVENTTMWERFFASTLWKRVFLPWLKAQREVQIRTILQHKDAGTRDVARGMALAFEQIINLPAALAASQKMEAKTSKEPEADATFYNDSIEFEENI